MGKSVSRVGGKSQLPAYREVVGNLRLSYSQFEELEAFARFGTKLDDETRKTLERGRRIREVLKQPRYEPMPAPEQIAILLAISAGLLDEIALDEIPSAKKVIRKALSEELPELYQRIVSTGRLSSEEKEKILRVSRDALKK
ncbi:MAG: F0F1 ATP synthase subunit alpha [Methanosaeta sp. PtaU1.Bin016]|nr:MAG: F0F1 ATP synthase subunit alpha [Methanosaeta sp. PtaU1.Bin016]